MNETYIVKFILSQETRIVKFIEAWGLDREAVIESALDYLSFDERKDIKKIDIIQGGDWIPEE